MYTTTPIAPTPISTDIVIDRAGLNEARYELDDTVELLYACTHEISIAMEEIRSLLVTMTPESNNLELSVTQLVALTDNAELVHVGMESGGQRVLSAQHALVQMWTAAGDYDGARRAAEEHYVFWLQLCNARGFLLLPAAVIRSFESYQKDAYQAYERAATLSPPAARYRS